MQVKAIKTDGGRYLAQYAGYYFYVSESRDSLVRMADEKEWNYALETWGEVVEETSINDIEKILQLTAISAKTDLFINSIINIDLDRLDIPNYQEQMAYVNNDFNYVFGFYVDGEVMEFGAKCGGDSTSEAGNHGTPISWAGETYIGTLQRFIETTGKYPSIMLVTTSNHQSRQGDGWGSEVIAYILPSKETIEAYFTNTVEAYNTLKNLPITIV